VTAFAGAAEDVDYQIQWAKKLASWKETAIDYDGAFSSTISVLPSKVADELQGLTGAYVARFGNGVIYHDAPGKTAPLPCPALAARVKKAYDPNCVFPEYSL
jgi:hypothetical protein